MATTKLSAPVGLDPRTSEGKPVKNKPADVVLVRKMLAANGIGPLGEAATMDLGLLKAIKVYQKKLGFKWPDQVIDPGGKTFKALKTKYDAQQREEAKIVMVEVKYRGKVHKLLPKDHEALVASVFKNLDGYTKSMIRHHNTCLDIYQDYLDTAQLKDGIMNAVAQAIIINAGSVKMPKSSVVGRSIKATGALERAIMSKNLTLLETALPEAEIAVNAFNAEISRFLKEFTGSAQTTATVLAVSSAACFAVVGALATPVLVAGGMSAAGAAAASGAGVGVLKSASEELGKHASGQKVTLWESVQAMVVDGTIGGLTGGIGSKIPLGFCDKMGKALAPRLASKVPFLAGKELEKFIANYLAGAGQESIKGAVGEALKAVGIMAKKGRIPTEKEFDAAVEAVLYAALLGGVIKHLGGFQKKFAYQHKATIELKLLPERLAKLTKNNDIPNVVKAKMFAEVMNKVSDEGMKAGFHEVYTRATGGESEKQLVDMADKAMLQDKGLQKLIDQELKKALKKQGIPAK